MTASKYTAKLSKKLPGTSLNQFLQIDKKPFERSIANMTPGGETCKRATFNGNEFFFQVKTNAQKNRKKGPKIYLTDAEKKNKNNQGQIVMSAVENRALVLECVASGVPTPNIRNLFNTF